MRLAITLLFLSFPFSALFAQKISSSKEFGNNRSLLIHELRYAQGLDDGFVILKEERKGVFNLIKHDLNLRSQWETRIIFDPQLDVPQMLIHGDTALLVSYTVKELERSVTIELKQINLSSGLIFSEARHTFPPYMAKSPYPRIHVSSDLSKILLANYFPATTGMPEINVLSTHDLSITKKVQLNKAIFDVPKINRFAIDNQGNVFFVSIHEALYRMDGHFIPAAGTEVRILPNDILYMRAMDNVPDVLIHVVEGSSYFVVAAAGNIQNELIGVKMTGYDFKRNSLPLDTTFDFTMMNVVELYNESVPTSKYVKGGSLKTPTDLIGYHLQELRLDSNSNILLFFEKNLQKSTYQRGFVSGNLVYTYNTNTKRKLQKSEDIVILSFDKEGGKRWGRVLQKYQVTRPFNYYMSYVSDLTDDVLSILTWTKRNNHSFQITQIEGQTGNLIKSGVDILKDGKFTYHKNYTTWINGNHIAITTQKNNKMNSRRMHVVKIE